MKWVQEEGGGWPGKEWRPASCDHPVKVARVEAVLVKMGEGWLAGRGKSWKCLL